MNKLPEIIGLAGTNGAGKDTLGDLRRDRHNARKVGLSDILRVEATKRNITHERDNLRTISTEMGAKLGAGALALTTIKDYYETKTDSETGLSIVSVRRPAEASAIQEADGIVLWIDADREMRYKRIQKAMRERIDDIVTYEQFCIDEDIELYPDADDSLAVNMSGVREIADLHITNEFNSDEEFKKYLIARFGL